MKKRPTWKRLKALWITVLVSGVIVTIVGVTPAAASARATARLLHRLSELERMAPQQQVSVVAYKEACEDGREISRAINKSSFILFYTGGVIFLVAVYGLLMNGNIRRMEEVPQQTGLRDSRCSEKTL